MKGRPPSVNTGSTHRKIVHKAHFLSQKESTQVIETNPEMRNTFGANATKESKQRILVVGERLINFMATMFSGNKLKKTFPEVLVTLMPSVRWVPQLEIRVNGQNSTTNLAKSQTGLIDNLIETWLDFGVGK